MNIPNENTSNQNINLKSILMQWREKLISKLDSKENEKIDIFLIEKDIIDNNLKTFFKNNINENELFKILLKSENNNKMKINKEINENSRFYILDEKCWNRLFGKQHNEPKIIYEGYFLNKILLFTKDQNFFFLYLDENKDIKKGFFKVNKEEISNIKNIIIDYFKENEPLKKDELFNKYGIKYNILNDNSIFEDKKKERMIIFDRINEKKSIKTNSFKECRNKKNDITTNKKLNEFKSGNFKNKDKEVKIHERNQNKENEKGITNKINKIPKNFTNIKNQHKNNNQKQEVKQKSKEYQKDINLKNIKDIFDPERKLVKRRPSVNNRKVINYNNILKNEENSNIADFDEFLPKKTKHKLSIPGVIGLSKISNIPFINPIIQCFSNVKRLKSELLKKEIYNDLEKNKSDTKKMSFALAEVLKNLWENLNLSVYEPKNFIEIITKNIGRKIEGPQNVIDFLLKEIHFELNLVKSKNFNNPTNQNMTFIKFFNYYKNNYENRNNSIISKEFNGYYIDKQGCFPCNNLNINSNSIHNFNILSFPLDEIRKFKNYNFNYITIYDCFEYYQRKESLFYACGRCGLPMNKSTQLLYMPNTLIINFEYKDNNVKIVYEEYLNLKKFIYFKNSPFYYELIGVICTNNNKNNFVAYCKNDKCEWYKYNDDKVSKSSFLEIDGIPYVLFFSYIQI